MFENVLAIPEHLRDALWRVESARVESRRSSGLLVCGMGGSAIGGDLAGALLADRLGAPLVTARGYDPPAWAGAGWTALCISYSGETEETLSSFGTAAERGARMIAASTGGTLVERAREAGAPVIGLPGILQPREAVAYMTVVVAEVAALAGVSPSAAEEFEAAAVAREGRSQELEDVSAAIAERIDGTIPVVHGAELTAPVARRWKTQIDENAKAQAFHSELPEADHNEICGWGGVPEGAPLSAVMVVDAEARSQVRRRFELTGEEIAAAGVEVVPVEATGDTAAERLFSAVMLGDMVSLRLAAARGVDPTAVAALDRLKSALARS
jgi:glucose/mannose-6-phosphate isomerase